MHVIKQNDSCTNVIYMADKNFIKNYKKQLHCHLIAHTDRQNQY